MRRSTTIRQRDSTDCGPACIASVMAYYGSRVTVARIRQLAGTDAHGTSMWGMVKALEHLDFETRGLKGTMEHLDKLPLPFIAHLELEDGLQHYICVYRVSRRNLLIMDPARGTFTRWSPDRFREHWSGAVVAMVKGMATPEPEKEDPARTKLLFLLQPVWKPLLQAILSGMLQTVLGLSVSLYIGKLTDHIFITHNTGLLNLLSSAMVFISLIMVYLFIVRSVIVLKTGQVIDNQLIIAYYRHLFRLPQRFFDTMRTGEVISRINDAVKIRGFINDAAITILINIVVLVSSFIIMFLLNWKLTMIILGMIPVYILIYFLFNSRNRHFERRVMEQTASFESQLVESLQSSTHIRQHRLEETTQLKTETRLNQLLDNIYRSGINLIAASGSTELINRLFTIILLWAGSYYVIRQQITPGTLLSFYALLGYFTGPVSSLIGANKTYQNALIAADRLFEIFQLEPEQSRGKRDFQVEDFGDITFHNVSFAYGRRGLLFRDLNLTIRAGKMTAITGASGSGKSTIASLVQQIYPVDEGSITINGCDTRYFSHASLRGIMGVVPQQVRFLTGTIMENVAPGERNPDMKRIIRLLQRLGLEQLVDTLPGGIEHLLTENGGNLSGGERQRLAIARALYRDPALLIMDEATSSLDAASAFYLHRCLLELKADDRTILLITHKEQYSSMADHTLILENGQIREF